MARSITVALVLLVAAVSATPVAPAAEMAKRQAPTPVEKPVAVIAAISPRPWKRDIGAIAVPAVITPRPWKREDDASSSSHVEQRDFLGGLLEKIGLGGSDDDGDDDGADDDGSAPKPGKVHADVATPRGWKRDADVATPKGWVKEKREPLAEAAANDAVMEEQKKRGTFVASGKGWKRDAMPTPRPFVS